MRKILWVATFVVPLFVFPAGAAWGWLFRVTDATELQDALTQAASNGQDDYIRVAQGTYQGNFLYESSEGRRIVVRGGYTGAFLSDRELDPSNTILDGGASGAALTLFDENGGEIEVEGFTITNGSGFAGAGLFTESYSELGPAGNITISTNVVTANIAGCDGGGILADSYSVSDQAGDVVISNNTITGNEGGPAGYGAGLLAQSYSGVGLSGDVTLSDNEIMDNIGYRFGGGAFAYSWGAGEVALSGNTFANNSALVAGGVYAYSNDGPVTMKGNTFSGNTADDHSGGGAYAGSDFGSITLTNNTFTDNSAGWGGGAFAYSETETITLTDNTFTGNSAFHSEHLQSDGGGVYADQHHDGAIILTRNLFDGNSATRNGGGVYARSLGTTGTATLTSNTLTGNTGGSWGQGSGGGAWVSASWGATLENNLFTDNFAYLGGGATVASSSSEAVKVANNTIAGNSADNNTIFSGAGLQLVASRAEIFNNIIWDNSSLSEFGKDLFIRNSGSGPLATVELHHNIYHSLGASNWDYVLEEDNIDQDPILTPDLRPQAGSPAIDAGTDVGAPDTDFEGDVRPQGYGYDIGADEFIEDTDGDGISDDVDTAPGVFSNEFEDGTGTYGVIIDRGDQELAITDALDPEGVRITANALGGPDPAIVRFCGGSYTATLSPGEFLVRGCSFEMDVLQGTAGLTLLGSQGQVVTASLETGNGLRFDPAALMVTAPATNTATLVVVVDGEEHSVVPGESALLSDACDVDGDGDIDLNDTEAIFDARGTAASGPDDPMDANGDGIITVNDGRICVLECDLENCEEPAPVSGSTAAPASCGLIGIEPFLLLGLPLWARRRRGGAR